MQATMAGLGAWGSSGKSQDVQLEVLVRCFQIVAGCPFEPSNISYLLSP